MADIFISYKSERRPAADHLAEILRDHGYTVWFDYSLITGSDFSRQIENQLKDAKAVIVLWCSLSVDSEWVRNEARFAKRRGTYLPVDIEPCELPLEYLGDQTVSLKDWDGAPRAFEPRRLLQDVERLVGRAPAPNLEAIERAHLGWVRYGKQRLAKFALIDPVKLRDEELAPVFDRPVVEDGGAEEKKTKAISPLELGLVSALLALAVITAVNFFGQQRADDDRAEASPEVAEVQQPQYLVWELEDSFSTNDCEESSLSCLVSTIAFSRDDESFLAVSDGRASLFKNGERRWSHDLNIENGMPAYGALSRDSQMVFIQHFQTGGTIHDIETGDLIAELDTGHCFPCVPSFSPDGRSIVATGDDGGVDYWDVETGNQLWHFEVLSPSISLFTPDGEMLLVTGDSSGSVHFLDPDSGQEIMDGISFNTDVITDLSIANDGRSVLIGLHNGEIFFLDLETRELENIFRVPSGQQIASLAFVSGIETAVIAPLGEPAALWSLTERRQIREFQTPGSTPREIAASNDGQRIAIGSSDGKIRIYRASVRQ